MNDKFDKPVNEWIEEEVEIPSFEPRVNEAKKRVEFVQATKKATRKTYYASSPARKVICAGGQHKFRSLDIHKSLFKCRECDFHKIAYPVTYKFNQETGKLIHRKTNIPV